MGFFPHFKNIRETAKRSKWLAVAMLFILLVSGVIEHAFFGWVHKQLAQETGSIMHIMWSLISLMGNNIIFSLVILAVFYCFFVVVGAQLHLIKSNIQGKQHMVSIILMALGILIFGIGIVMYCIQLSRSIIIPPTSSSQPTMLNQSYEDVIKKQRYLNDSLGEFMAKQNNLNQSYKEIIGKQTRLYLLKRDKGKLESLILNYEKIAPEKYNQYVKDHPGPSTTMRSYEIKKVLTNYHNGIINLSKDDFNEDLIFDVVDTKKYDINMPFVEEDNIKDKPIQYEYRKLRYEYLSNKDKIDNLMSRFNREIMQNEVFIDEYAKRIIHVLE